MKLHYSATNATGLPVIFIHGNSVDGTVFQADDSQFGINKLKKICLDLPGHGNSPRLNDYKCDIMGNILADFIEQTFPDGYFMVAHSLSGHLVLQCLHQYTKLKKLLLVGTPPLKSPEDILHAFHAESSRLLFKPEWTDSELKALCEISSKKHPEIIRQALLKCVTKFKSDFLSPGFLENFNNEQNALTHTKTPVVVSWCEDEAFINIRFLQQLMEVFKESQNIRFHSYSFGGHYPFLDNPEEFYSFAMNFFLDQK